MPEYSKREPLPPSTAKVYRQTETELEATCNFIQDSLTKGYITNSKSPYASGLFYRAKADGKFHPIMDYHALNKWTVHDTYPLPLISNILDHLQGKTSSPSLTSIGGSTTYKSKKRTSGKPHSKLLLGYTNLPSCTLASPIPPLPSAKP